MSRLEIRPCGVSGREQRPRLLTRVDQRRIDFPGGVDVGGCLCHPSRDESGLIGVGRQQRRPFQLTEAGDRLRQPAQRLDAWNAVLAKVHSGFVYLVRLIQPHAPEQQENDEQASEGQAEPAGNRHFRENRHECSLGRLPVRTELDPVI